MLVQKIGGCDLAKVLAAHGADKSIYVILFRCELYQNLNPTQWPIVYSSNYNISFFGLQKLHPFDSEKWGRTVEYLLGMQHFSLFYVGNPRTHISFKT